MTRQTLAPVEEIASGKALARAAGVDRAEDVLDDPSHAGLVDAAVAELAGVLAVLANALDPTLIVLGGGLGTAPVFRMRVEAAVRSLLAYPASPPLAVAASELGADAGIVGAALRAAGDG